MLHEEQVKAIDYLVEGKEDKRSIAVLCNISHSTLYNWLKDEEFKQELDKRIVEIKEKGERRITKNLDRSIQQIELLAQTAKSEKVRLEAAQYLVDRSLGKPTTKLDVEAGPKQDTNKIDEKEIEDMFNNWDSEEVDDN